MAVTVLGTELLLFLTPVVTSLSSGATLNLDRKPQQFKFGIAGGGYCCENSALVSLWIRRYDKAFRFNIQAFELETPAHKTPKLENRFFQDNHFLKSIGKFIPKEAKDVDILLGFDYANLMAPTSYLTPPNPAEKYPQAAETALGWYIFGSSATRTIKEDSRLPRVQFLKSEELDIRRWYESDICGVKPTQICNCKENEIVESQFLKHARKTIRQTEEGRVEVSLPWKSDFPSCLKSNRKQALVKLYSLERRLAKSNLLNIYTEEMNRILDEFVEPVPESDLKNENAWYLDHFPVIRSSKTTPCRIVWNSAALYNGVALNDGLNKGPDLLNSLFLVLLAWRQNPIALAGDIKKMFNQVQIAPHDRAYHRFLWRNGNSKLPVKDYQWKRLLFGDKSAPNLAISALHFLADKHSNSGVGTLFGRRAKIFLNFDKRAGLCECMKRTRVLSCSIVY